MTTTSPEDRFYGEDLRCTACGEHLADPHAPECDERFEAVHGDGGVDRAPHPSRNLRTAGPYPSSPSGRVRPSWEHLGHEQ